MVFYLSQATQTDRQTGRRMDGAHAVGRTSGAQPGQVQLSAGSGQTQGPRPPPSASVSPGAGSDGDHRCHCRRMRWSRTHATRPDFLSGGCFGHRRRLRVSEQLLSITSLPPSRGGCRSQGSGCLRRSPPHCRPCSGGGGSLGLPRAGTPGRLSAESSSPWSSSPAQSPPLFVPASPRQLCEPSLGIWFVSSWQCHPPKCHGMQKSMKTRDPRHVFLFVCMCQHFQWLRNVCL